MKDFKPAYLLLPGGVLKERVMIAERILRECTLCPRNCRVDRHHLKKGFCKTGDLPFVSSYNPHFGEEAPLVGSHGSGTIFFSGCNLGCIFCQNYSISHLLEGTEVSLERLAGMMLELQGLGCHNINLVTPTHQVPMILGALEIAVGKGLSIPLVYNCGGYESVETLRLLDGIVDIYMPDIKFADSKIGFRYTKARNYFQKAKAAVREMHRQTGDLVMDSSGLALRGLLVRHLVLPNNLAGTRKVLEFIASVSKNTYINIMDQYHPCYKAVGDPELGRRITRTEYEEAVEAALDLGIVRIDDRLARGPLRFVFKGL